MSALYTDPVAEKLLAGTVANTPSSASDDLFVTVDSYGSRHRYGPCPWEPHGTALPFAGTSCLVALDENGSAWVVAWDGSTVISPDPTVIMPPPSGDTGGAIDAAAITAALASLPGGRGVIQFRPGIYYDNLQRDRSTSTSETWRGTGGRSAGAVPGTIIEYTGTASSYLKVGNSVGFALEDMMVLYSNASFTGTLIDGTGTDTVGLRVSRFYLGTNTGGTTAAAIVNLSNCQTVTLEDGEISGGTYGVIGRSLVGQFSTAVTISHVEFTGNATRHIKNAGEGWTIDEGSVFEALVGGGAGAYSCDFATGPITFADTWMGDVTIAGTNQISFTGDGLTVLGGMIGNNALGGGGGIVVNTGSSAIDIRGVKFEFHGTAIDLTAAGITDAEVGPCTYLAVTTPIAGGASLSKSRRRGWSGLIAPDFPGPIATQILVSNVCFYGRFVPSEDITISQLAFVVTIAAGSNDNCDVGIYDATTLARLASAGSTAGKLNSTGRKTVSLTAPVSLRAGKVYYAGFAGGPVGSTAATIASMGFSSTAIWQLMGTAAPDVGGGAQITFPLPATATVALNGSVALLAVLQ